MKINPAMRPSQFRGMPRARVSDAEFVRGLKRLLGTSIAGPCGQRAARRIDRIAARLDGKAAEKSA